MIILEDGNILESKAKYIAHQCNCFTNSSSGVARAIFDKYPWSNTYHTESKLCNDRIPGTIHVLNENDKYVINMYSQNYPGGPSHYETEAQREQWFLECLNKIELIQDVKSIAFPHFIGCGLAGGNWDHYYKMISDLDVRWTEKGIDNIIYIVRLV